MGNLSFGWRVRADRGKVFEFLGNLRPKLPPYIETGIIEHRISNPLRRRREAARVVRMEDIAQLRQHWTYRAIRRN